MLRLIIRYLKFSGTSVIGTVVDTLVLWLLSDMVFHGRYWGEYMISPAISFQCAVAVNFLISYFYVWKDRIRGRQDAGVKLFFRLMIRQSIGLMLRTNILKIAMGIILLKKIQLQVL